jgi:hypothetical protein
MSNEFRNEPLGEMRPARQPKRFPIRPRSTRVTGKRGKGTGKARRPHAFPLMNSSRAQVRVTVPKQRRSTIMAGRPAAHMGRFGRWRWIRQEERERAGRRREPARRGWAERQRQERPCEAGQRWEPVRFGGSSRPPANRRRGTMRLRTPPSGSDARPSGRTYA